MLCEGFGLSKNETNETDNSHDVNDEDLEDLMMDQLQKQRRPVHRRSDGYERKHIYRGAVVKQNENE